MLTLSRSFYSFSLLSLFLISILLLSLPLISFAHLHAQTLSLSRTHTHTHIPSLSSHSLPVTSVHSSHSPYQDTSAFVVGRPRVATSQQTPTLDIKQFTLAVEMLARRVYAGLIEQQTGTTLECLPPKQREVASKAALEVLIKKKLFPAAEKV